MKSKSVLRLGRIGSRPLAIALFALLAAHAAQAATSYWDGDATAPSNNAVTGANLGGTGNWNNSGSGTPLLNWWNGSAGSDQTWVNANNDNALFWGTAGTVSLTDAIAVGGLTFNTTGYIVDASANALTFGATNNTITLNNIAAATITGTVAGTGSNVTLSCGFGTTAGTVNCNGTSAGGWTGTTTVNAGITLALSASNQALYSTSGITLNGGGITLTNANSTEGALDRVDSVTITTNGGTLTYANTSGLDLTYTETLGTVALTTGQLNLAMSNDMTGTGTNAQTLTLGALTQAGTSAVTFSAAGTGLGIAATPSATNLIKVTGAGTTASGAIIAPWATVGTAANAQTDYAVYASGQAVGAGIAATGQASWSDSTATGNYTFSSADTLGGTRTINTLCYTGGANSLALGSNNLETFGIFNGGSGLLTISGTGVVRQNGTAAATLYVTTGSTAANITISAPIQNNTGALSLVKNGAGTLTLGNASNTFSGKIVINGGTLYVPSAGGLGSAPGSVTADSITINGGTLDGTGSNTNYNTNRGILIGPAGATFGSNLGGWSGPISGSGNLYIYSGQFRMTGGGSGGSVGSYDNTYTGDTIPVGSANVNPYRANSFRYSTLDLSQSTGGNPLTNINGCASPVVGGLKGTGNMQMPAGNVYIGNNNKDTTYSGVMSGANPWFKIGSGTLTLAGANTYTGATTVSAGTLALGATGSVNNTSGITLAAGALLDTAAKNSYAMPASPKFSTFHVDGAGSGSCGRIHAAGLDITSAVVVLTVDNALDDPVYILADYTSLSGSAFASVTPPEGYTINYAYNGGTQIALVTNSSTLHHFDVTATSPQTAGSTFSVTVTAKDASGSTLTTDNSTVVTLTSSGSAQFDSNGDGSFGDSTKTLSNGTFTINTKDNLAEGVTLTATGGGKTGSSSPITVRSPFQAWANGASFTADTNGDGVANGLAWRLGASGPSDNAVACLPKGSSSGTGDLVLEFDCLKPANSGTAALVVQYSKDLGVVDPWDSASKAPSVTQASVPSAPSSVGGIAFAISPSPLGAIYQHVVASIPHGLASSDGKLFARLQATE